ncbi:hypothetical protein J7E52_02090 [Bacillus sp. ISL-34]|uniref:YslB family protein n=1 Tax=Bacillus sp. ISL-34 TaxID=2819121 RepID=UPI001BECACB6|nr:YslB family protein [Bacillus sp. ISL-34]MBT2645520.1 hypothetical protein [Bacillus sp. ISL-34]
MAAANLPLLLSINSNQQDCPKYRRKIAKYTKGFLRFVQKVRLKETLLVRYNLGNHVQQLVFNIPFSCVQDFCSFFSSLPVSEYGRNEIQFQRYPELLLYESIKHEKACFQMEAGFLAKV